VVRYGQHLGIIGVLVVATMRAIATAVLILCVGCGVASWADVTPRGTELTFDVITWNVENFPQQGQITIDSVRMIILGLQVDLVAMQEITDTTAFRDLVNSMDEWDGIYSSDEYSPGSYQKTGILWRTDQVAVTNPQQLFPGLTYPFPRSPLLAEAVWQRGQQVFDFHIIVLHLKAGGTPDDLERRRQACGYLKDFVDLVIGQGWDPDFILAGDWNDELDDPPDQNAFTVFLDDSLHYQFLTMPLAGDPFWASYPFSSNPSLIDHILVTVDALGEYEGGWTETLRLEQEVSNYSYYVSDHRPVMSQFPVTPSAVDPAAVNSVPTSVRLLGAYPNPCNPGTFISYELASPRSVRVAMYNLLGQEVTVLVDGDAGAGRHQVWWDGTGRDGMPSPSGMYVVRLAAGRCQATWRIVLLK
jgi:endonuclease/exonuclease/phosphatase family metal-dependent hydrolase